MEVASEPKYGGGSDFSGSLSGNFAFYPDALYDATKYMYAPQQVEPMPATGLAKDYLLKSLAPNVKKRASVIPQEYYLGLNDGVKYPNNEEFPLLPPVTN